MNPLRTNSTKPAQGFGHANPFRLVDRNKRVDLLEDLQDEEEERFLRQKQEGRGKVKQSEYYSR